MIRQLSIPVAGLLGIVLVIWSGTDADQYKLYVMNIPEPHPYPIKGVLTICGFIAAESFILYGILRPRSFDHSWIRGIVAFSFLFMMDAVFTIFLMHAPTYFLVHTLWLSGMTLGALGLIVYSVIGKLWKRRRIRHSRRERPDE